MKIIVAGNCQTGAVAACIQQIFPRANVIPYSATSLIKCAKNIYDEISSSNFLLLGNTPAIRNHEFEFKQCVIIKFPIIDFSAFHPDSCCTLLTTTGTGKSIPQFSSIACWSIQNGLDLFSTLKLFNDRTYRALGYYDMWDPAVGHLNNAFSDCGFTKKEFDKFYLNIKRRGIFMYTPTHPKLFVLEELSKIIALRIGAHESSVDRPLFLSDALVELGTYPVYPEVASNLGLNGFNLVKLRNGKILFGLEAILRYFYRINNSPEKIKNLGSLPQTQNMGLSEVLSAQI